MLRVVGAGECGELTHRLGRGCVEKTLLRRLTRLLASWAKRLRIRSSCLSSSEARPRDAMFEQAVIATVTLQVLMNVSDSVAVWVLPLAVEWSDRRQDV